MGQERDFSLSVVTDLLPRWGINMNTAQKIMMTHFDFSMIAELSCEDED